MSAARPERPPLLQELPDEVVLVDEALVVRDANERLPEILAEDRLRPPCTLDRFFDARFLEQSGLLKLLESARRRGQEERAVPWPSERGGVRHLVVEVRPLAGRDACSLVRVLDLTERIAFERTLKDSERRATVGRIAGTLAHELSNPVTGVRVLAEILRDRVGERDRDLVEEIAALAARMGDTLRDLLRLLEPVEEVPEKLQAARVAYDVTTEVRRWPVAEGRKIVAEIEDGEGLLVRGVAGRLRIALANLLENALEAAGEGGTVRLRLRTDGDWILFEVEDSGPGLEGEARQRLFEPFFSRKRGGTGLGLVLVLTIAREHGGSVAVDDSPDLGGARFRLCLPRASG